MEKERFDAYVRNYERVLDGLLPPGTKGIHFLAQKAGWVGRILRDTFGDRRDLRVLDFGCRTGALSRCLAENPQIGRLAGVDLSIESLREAEVALSGAGKPFCSAERLDDLPRSERFDLVTVFNVFHHIPPTDRRDQVHAIARRLDGGGVLLVWEQNPWNPFTRLLVRACPFDEGVQLLSRSEATELCAAGELQFRHGEWVNVTPPSLHRWGLFRALERWVSAIPLGAQYRLVFQLPIERTGASRR